MKIYCSKIRSVTGHEAAYALLEYAYRLQFGQKLPEIAKADGGKPFFPSMPEVCFSLSHTREYVLCALGSAPVGADVETVREIRPALDRRVRSDAERASFDFFQSWVLKESYVKLLGRADRPLRDICFTGAADNIVTPAPGVYARLYDTVPGCRAAVCAFSPELPEEIIFVEI